MVVLVVGLPCARCWYPRGRREKLAVDGGGRLWLGQEERVEGFDALHMPVLLSSFRCFFSPDRTVVIVVFFFSFVSRFCFESVC